MLPKIKLFVYLKEEQPVVSKTLEIMAFEGKEATIWALLALAGSAGYAGLSRQTLQALSAIAGIRGSQAPAAYPNRYPMPTGSAWSLES